MSNSILTFLAALFAGYFLLNLPLGGTFLAIFAPALKIIAIIVVIVFAAVLIYKGLLAILGKG
ncbi:hypothetical protein [Fictibacillus gelatini]|uniref:hypothetical protein n=1 Tax=Fictibacillus gelatini TaxID=225985 RepID=UPI0004196B99|nr:hypothetical protein [Fictibacillus gelatini]